jgi:lipopolysaccharide transport system ATP-binding protein
MASPVISVRGISKRYHLGAMGGHDTLRDQLAHGTKSLLRRLQSAQKPKENGEDETFWALKDVSFDLGEGEVLGVIGSNGAGKSTLLKLLSQITEPTLGEVCIRGRVASLLEVGTGFHPELTGRENIYLNGAILGMSKAETRKKFDEIVAFAEVERFLDTPVKRYSSGMYMRLAFAVAAHLEPEILIVDEVLAVGDARFQDRCMDRMRLVSGRGRTILFVSHNMVAIRSLCRNVIILERGRLVFAGPTAEGVALYAGQSPGSINQTWTRPPGQTPPCVSFERLHLSLTGKQPALTLHCEMAIRCVDRSDDAFVAVDIFDDTGAAMMQALPQPRPFLEMGRGLHQLTMEIELPPLVPGRYIADAWVGSHYTSTYDWLKRALAFEILETPSPGRTFPHTLEHGRIVPVSRVRVTQIQSSSCQD